MQAFLQLLCSINTSLSKLEEVLSIGPSNPSNSPKKPIDDAKILSRAATGYNQLQFLIKRADDAAFVSKSGVGSRLTAVLATLQSGLGNALMQNLNSAMNLSRNSAAQITALGSVGQYLRIYVLIDRIDDAKNSFVKTVVTPFFDEVCLDGIYDVM